MHPYFRFQNAAMQTSPSVAREHIDSLFDLTDAARKVVATWRGASEISRSSIASLASPQVPRPSPPPPADPDEFISESYKQIRDLLTRAATGMHLGVLE